MVDSIEDKKSLKILITIFIIGSIGFLLFITPLLLKNNSGNYCESLLKDKNYMKTLGNSEVILKTPNSYFYENVYDSNNQYNDLTIREEYCFYVFNNGTELLQTNIIDSNLTVINKAIINTGYSNYCVLVDKNSSFLGLQCLNCNDSNTLIMQQINLNDTENIILNNNALTVHKLSSSNKLFLSCKNSIKNYTITYIIFVSLIILSIVIVLIIKGFGVLFDKW